MYKIEFINLQDIHLFYRHLPSYETLYKRLNFIKAKGTLFPYLTVESNPTQKSYQLIDGYQEYETLHFIDSNKKVPCWVAPYTSEKGQIYLVLKKLYTFDRVPWLLKYDLIKLLIDKGETKPEVANQLQITPSQVERYQINKEVPRMYIQRGIKNNAATKLNRICKLDLESEIKMKLYDKAVLPEGHPERLIHDQIDAIVRMMSYTKGFLGLSSENQKTFLNDYVLEYRMVLEMLWQDKINDFIFNNDPSEDGSSLFLQ
ncbi:hypothetical protein [Pseudalkalibacillus decolorationis]|uniref:hypothetical protein n=1 Tax=Pseudalkalibacillus decolorationis TaxID=163879 RepID=UPI002147A16D|nr:hypothetical protein [Pseudalkalibacillus decolorationis]